MKPDGNKPWYFTSKGNQSGPVPFSELVRLAELGLLDRKQDKVWCEGLVEWIAAGQIEGLFKSPPRLEAMGAVRMGARQPTPFDAAPARFTLDGGLAYPLRPVSYALVATFIALTAAAGAFAAFSSTIVALEGPRNSNFEAMVIAFGCQFVFGVFATIFGGIVLHRMWRLLPASSARTTPGRAVGLCFVPIFNFFWIFVASYSWAGAYNSFSATQPHAPRVSEGVFLAIPIVFCCGILGAIPFVGVVQQLAMGVLLLCAFHQGCRAVNHFALRNERTAIASDDDGAAQ